MSLHMSSRFIYLASQSPRRQQLLEQLGVELRLLVPNAEGDIEEDAEALEVVRPHEAPARYVQRVTAAKLVAARARLQRRGGPAAPILCSDTTVALGREIYGKPENPADAVRMLSELSGRTHRVLTAVAVQGVAPDQIGRALSVSQVRFAAMSRAQIDDYVASGEPMGKAGAYAIQGRAAAWVSHLSGSYTGIMGLPLFEVAELLRPLGFLI
jgi:septum formation protein